MKIAQVLPIFVMITLMDAFPQELDQRIRDGRKCALEEYSYLASIIAMDKSIMCGASLIAPRWIVSAAHCCDYITRKHTTTYTVVVGQSEWLKDVEQSSVIDGVFLPSDYSVEPLTSDICLIRLANPIQPSSRVKISKLATTKEFEELIEKEQCKRVLALGFGLHAIDFGSGSQKATSLSPAANTSYVKCIDMTMTSRDECQKNKEIKKYIGETVFCMVAKQEGPCNGDTGGPVYCGGMQIGVVSSSLSCANEKYPSFYTRVGLYKDFFDKIINFEERGAENSTAEGEVVTQKVTPVRRTTPKSSGNRFIVYYKILIFLYISTFLI